MVLFCMFFKSWLFMFYSCRDLFWFIKYTFFQCWLMIFCCLCLTAWPLDNTSFLLNTPHLCISTEYCKYCNLTVWFSFIRIWILLLSVYFSVVKLKLCKYACLFNKIITHSQMVWQFFLDWNYTRLFQKIKIQLYRVEVFYWKLFCLH